MNKFESFSMKFKLSFPHICTYLTLRFKVSTHWDKQATLRKPIKNLLKPYEKELDMLVCSQNVGQIRISPKYPNF